MSTSTISPRLALATEKPSGHDHDGCCSGQLTFGPDGRLVLSVVCDDCGETVAVLSSLGYQLKPKLGAALDRAA
jgi:hypothetical protein